MGDHLDQFVDDLLNDDKPRGPSQPPNQNAMPVAPRGVVGTMGQVPVRGPVGRPQVSMPPSGLAGLAGNPSLGKPSTMPAYPVSAPTHGGVSVGNAGGARQHQNPIIPSHLLPSSVSTVGFANSGGMRPTTGGLGSLQAGMTVQGTNGPLRVAVAPGAGPSPISISQKATTTQLPVPVPQPVSAKAASAAMSKTVVSTSVPAQKKQMISESGASRLRNADGTIKEDNGGDEEEEELISRDFDELESEPILYGKSRLTDEDIVRERAKDESRKLVNLQTVKVMVDGICKSEGLQASPKIAEVIALAVHQRISDVLETMNEFSRRRMDVEGDTGSSSIVRSSNPRLYFKEQETKRQEEREKRLAAKSAAESGVAAMDPSALRRQEEETEATVLDFAAPARRPRAVLPPRIESTHNPSSMDISSAGASIYSVKDRTRRITLSDALRFLRQDKHSKHSQLTLNTLAGLKIPESFTLTGAQHTLSAHGREQPTGIATRSSITLSAAQHQASPQLMSRNYPPSSAPQPTSLSVKPSMGHRPTVSTSPSPMPGTGQSRPLPSNVAPSKPSGKPTMAPSFK